DPEPSDGLLAEILDRVAKASTDAGRIEVPFDRLTPEREDELWSRDCAEELIVPLGRSGARKVQELRLGLGTRQHALIAGRTGSGKSTLLHVMITAAGMWYGPDQLEMYLIDFKKGVEFKAYTGGRLPHVRAVAIESDREFGLSVLQRLDDELTKRGELFRKLGAQDLAGARKLAPDEHLPRVLLLIDEFQEFFTVDDDVASDASLLLDRLVRQGRAFGVHVILGSQTLSGAYSLARSTLGQIGVRVALQCSEADSYLILGEDNNAARLLERPGEAIYNNAGGLIEGNSPFQTAWLPDSDRDAALNRLPEPSIDLEPAVVFEGNTLAQFEKTRAAMLHEEAVSVGPRVLLGESVAIAPPVAPMMTKRSGANMLVVGPQATSAYGMLASGAITFAATKGARVVVLDATPEEDPEYHRIEHAIQGRGENIELRRAADATRIVSEFNGIVQSRDGHAGDPMLLVIAGL
ncbi:MAG: FtsK/SpoIIIE domain-containing protein, partial [Phycisphaerales bacterium]